MGGRKLSLLAVRAVVASFERRVVDVRDIERESERETHTEPRDTVRRSAPPTAAAPSPTPPPPLDIDDVVDVWVCVCVCGSVRPSVSPPVPPFRAVCVVRVRVSVRPPTLRVVCLCVRECVSAAWTAAAAALLSPPLGEVRRRWRV